MGNEDAIVCKEKYNTSKNCDFAEIESLKQALEKTRLTDFKDDEENKVLDFVRILPIELSEEIFLQLSTKDLAACTAVSSGWRNAVNSNKVWNSKCVERGWKDNLNLTSSHFNKAHRQFRWVGHTYDSFPPICQKRLFFNQYSCLQENWQCGKYIKHKILTETRSWLQLIEPVACDSNYLVLLEKTSKKISTIGVWSLDGIPFKLCDLLLSDQIHDVEAIAIDYNTIATIQNYIIRVYFFNQKTDTFQEAYVKNELFDLMPSNEQILKGRTRLSSHLKVTQSYIICVPSFSHSTDEFVPIFFWDRITGQLKHTLHFDSMYYQITKAVWFGDSCFLSLSNKKKKTYQVVEFNIKTAVWEAFSQNVTMEVEEIAVSNKYILAVTKKMPSNDDARPYFVSRNNEDNKEVWLWCRTTGSVLKSFDTRGKGFQFVSECLMFFDSALVTVMDPIDNVSGEFEVSGTVLAIKATCHLNLVLIIKTTSYIEVWDWSLGCRLYTINGETNLSSHVWCDAKRVITFKSPDAPVGGVLILGFW